jgi:LmbE family N-acetylglucosaminyl deacetylase
MGILAAITDPDRPRIDAARLALVVAHPDDETIGAGALLARLDGATVVTVTDGAPRGGDDVARLGFASPEDYAAARAAELDVALSLAGVDPARRLRLEVPDQQAAFRLGAVARRLAELFAAGRIDTVLTHALEGGHPDHDATAAAVHLAARLGAAPLAMIEMPLYHLGPTGMVTQSFCDGIAGAVLVLSAEERAAKRRMLACHATQAATLKPFGVAAERFRHAPAYDLAVLPNSGRALYAGHNWGLRPEAWPAHVRDALRALRLEAAA